MLGNYRTFALTALFAVAYCQLALGQAAPATILDIELNNYVVYWNDVTDNSRLATDPNRTTVTQARNFGHAIGIADIVSVNGKPAKGVLTEQRTQFNLRVNPTGGQAVADSERNNRIERLYEILKPDGTQIGSIISDRKWRWYSSAGSTRGVRGRQPYGHWREWGIPGGTGATE